jgi:hypothetical protein
MEETMTVGELKKMLENHPDDAKVVVSSDDEWNNLRFASEITDMFVLDPEECEVVYGDELVDYGVDDPENYDQCIVIS